MVARTRSAVNLLVLHLLISPEVIRPHLVALGEYSEANSEMHRIAHSCRRRGPLTRRGAGMAARRVPEI
jgi:hypothetical protein